MTDPATGFSPERDRHGRRAVWIAFALTMIGQAIVYKHKADDDRSAIVRWCHQILELQDGVDIFRLRYFPTPPMFPITLYPIAALPPVTGAVTYFAIKAMLAAVCMIACLRMAVPKGTVVPWWGQLGMVLLCLRPIMGDLHHANNNLIILSLIVATLAAWRRGYDVLAGLCLGLAITYKITPALFVPFFMYKRSWKTVVSTFVGIGLFLFVIPSLVLGPEFNLTCLQSWWNRVLGPFVEHGTISPQEVNQSMVGVVARLLTFNKIGGEHANGSVQMHLNLVSWPPKYVSWLVKGLSLALVGLLPIFCRTKTTRRDDPRLFGEFALVVLTMLFVSERSWKAHYVTMVLPYAYLVARVSALPGPKSRKWGLAGLLLLSAFFMACTSSEFGFLFGEKGHKVAQFYGLFLLAGLVVYAATAWRVVAERDTPLGLDGESSSRAIPAPHIESKHARAEAR